MNEMLPKIARTLVAAVTFSAVAVAAQAEGVKGDAAAGKGKAEMCIGCHGILGYQNSFPEIHKVPKIGGQSAEYIVSALNAYKKGDRKHPSMRGIGGSLTDQDMADLAAFYSGQGEGAAPEQQVAPSEAVAALLAKGNCASCHGANFSKPIDPTYPKIAGQYPDYLYVALKAYTVEGNNVVGRANPIMGGMAKLFNHDELKQLSGYIGSLQGEMRTVPQSKFR